MAINDVSRVTHLPDMSRVQGQTQVPVAPRYNANQQGQTLFSASESYRNQQLEMRTLLEAYGFNSDQAFKLSQIGNLSIRQFARSVILAQMLLKETQLFENFAKTLKQIVSRGQNVKESVRTFLDGLDKVIGQDTRKLAEKILLHPNAEQHEIEAVVQKNYSQHPQHHDAKHFEQNLAKDLNLTLLKSLASAPVGAKDAVDFQKFLNFFAASMEEFPTRFQIDVFAQGELNRKGLTLENYIKLASEIPPLRLINVLTQADKQGHAAQIILNTLLSAQDNGENLMEVLETLEHQFLPQNPLVAKPNPALHSPLAFVQALPDKHVPLTTSSFTMEQGEDFILSFLALDVAEGVLATENTGFVIFPQQTEHVGRELNLSQFPVGVYYVMLAGLPAKNKMMNLWMKVIIEEKRKSGFPNQDQDGEQRDDSDFEQNRERRKNMLEDSPPEKAAEDAVTMDFKTQPVSQGGRFLGEIVLPLEIMQNDPDELVVLAPDGCVIVSKDEYESGTFAHNAVTFRFLTHYIDAADLRKRHDLLHLRESNLFKTFDSEVKRFLKNPKSELSGFRSVLDDFFTRLKKMFPTGEQTFDVAKRVFQTEAETFAGGETGGELYQVNAVEGDAKKFIASCYAKGGYALASSGDVPGALQGMACATLVDLEDTTHQAALGEYLENLKSIYYAKVSKESVQNHYSTHLGHAFRQTVATSPYYADLGKQFVKAVALLPPATTEPGARPSPYSK